MTETDATNAAGSRLRQCGSRSGSRVQTLDDLAARSVVPYFGQLITLPRFNSWIGETMTTLTTGMTLGPWTLGRKLGAGAFGHVFEGVDGEVEYTETPGNSLPRVSAGRCSVWWMYVRDDGVTLAIVHPSQSPTPPLGSWIHLR